MKPRAVLIFSLISPWCAPITEFYPLLTSAFEMNSAIGNAAWASYAVTFIGIYSFYQGADLNMVKSQFLQFHFFNIFSGYNSF